MNTSESLYKAAITEINEHLNQARAASRNNDLGNALKHALAAIDAQAHLIRHLIARRLAFIAGFASVAFAGSLVKAEPAQEASTDPSSHRISYDSYSLKIDGKRIFLYSGESIPTVFRVLHFGETSSRRLMQPASMASRCTLTGATIRRRQENMISLESGTWICSSILRMK